MVSAAQSRTAILSLKGKGPNQFTLRVDFACRPLIVHFHSRTHSLAFSRLLPQPNAYSFMYAFTHLHPCMLIRTRFSSHIVPPVSTRAIRDHAFVDESRNLVYERVERFVPHIVRDMKYAAEKDEDVVRQSSARGLHVDASVTTGQQRPKLNRAQAALRFTGFVLTFDAGGAIAALAPSKQSDILGGLVDSLAAYKSRDKVKS